MLELPRAARQVGIGSLDAVCELGTLVAAEAGRILGQRQRYPLRVYQVVDRHTSFVGTVTVYNFLTSLTEQEARMIAADAISSSTNERVRALAALQGICAFRLIQLTDQGTPSPRERPEWPLSPLQLEQLQAAAPRWFIVVEVNGKPGVRGVVPRVVSTSKRGHQAGGAGGDSNEAGLGRDGKRSRQLEDVVSGSTGGALLLSCMGALEVELLQATRLVQSVVHPVCADDVQNAISTHRPDAVILSAPHRSKLLKLNHNSWYCATHQRWSYELCLSLSLPCCLSWRWIFFRRIHHH